MAMQGENEKSSRKVMLIKIKDIIPGDNTRQEFDQTALTELMQNMKGNGLLSPVGVRKLPSGKFKMVFGHRRMLAAERLGWDKIEAIDVDVVDEKDALMKTSSENIFRENVSMPEQGRVFKELMRKGMTMEQIAVRMGCKKKFVENCVIAFDKIPSKFHERITYGTRGVGSKKDGSIPATVALQAVNLKKEHGLNDSQVGQIMEWASRTGANVVKMRTAGQLIADGVEPKKAMEKVEYMRVVAITMTMKVSTIQKLQVKYGKSIHDIIYNYLEGNEEFELLTNRVRDNRKDMPETVIRKTRKKARLDK